MIDLRQRWRLNEAFVWEPMPDGCILYCQQTGQILTVNPAAELILSYCDGLTSMEDVLRAVNEDLALAPGEFDEVVKALIEQEVLKPASP
jgi:PAS domain-containing protein